MKAVLKIFGVLVAAMGGYVLLSSFLAGTLPMRGTQLGPALRLPWRQAGLTERQAAAHLLSRFTYGAMPGQVDAVVKMGLENWFAQQLAAQDPDDSLEQILSRYDALELSNEQVAETYPRNGQVIRMAIRDGVVDKDSVKADRVAYRQVIRQYMEEKGYKRQQELFRQFFCQKILRAAYSENQLQEVMTDFWFNHFNVSLTKNDCAEFIPAYERDVIRPNALGRFNELLLKTAKSPAMLYYLDNFNSSGPARDTARKRARGLNENYAREVMELHTLGVDGGYTQQDVTEAARVLTGWGVRLREDGDFFFDANRHDQGEKVVMGHVFPAGGGYEEGVDLLNMLAHHPSTAKFICHKIAVRFVNDDPPATLVDKMANTFLEKNGDIRQVLITMVSAPEFWSAGALREKTKSPFELAIGAVRSLHATIDQPMQLYNWVTRMGEREYYYQAPTGFPDKGAYWINTGSLLSRMNFGLALAAGRIPGVRVDLLALNHGHEPESAQAALLIYGHLILPERNLDATVKRLTPMLNERDSTMTAAVEEGDPMLAQVVGIIIGSPEYQRR